MWLSDLSIRRPVFAAVIAILLVAFGTLNFTSLPLRELPDIDAPVVSVRTNYTGASPSVVETRITQVLEDQLSGLEGIKSIESSSRFGSSRINIEFQLNRPIEAATNDVRDAISRVASRLPDEADTPRVRKENSNQETIVWYNMSSTTLDNFEMTEYADRYIVDRMSAINGVASVRIGGERKYSMRIWLDPAAMAAHGVTVSDIETTLRRENVELPAGSIEAADRDVSLRVERAYASPDDFSSLVMKKGNDGHLVRLGDVARVELDAAVRQTAFSGNGLPQVSVGIIKQSKANTVEVVRATNAEIVRIRPSLPPGTELHFSYDKSVFVAEAIKEVYRTLFIAMSLVIVVIFLFLGSFRAALVPAITVPVSIIATFSAFALFGLSINLLTLLALVLAIGLVVDDSIVVLENAQKHVDNGDPPLLAAQNGTREVAFAVIATTIVLISVFAPVAFLQDAVGKLFAELAITLSAAVAVSSLIALTVSPMICSKVLRPRQTTSGAAAWLGRLLDRATEVYVDLVRTALGIRWVIFGVAAFMVVGAVVLFRLLPSELAPREDRGLLFGRLQTPLGSSFDYTKQEMDKAERVLMKFVESGDIDRLLVRVPGSFSGRGEFNTGRLIMVLAPWGERNRSGFEILRDIRRELNKIPSLRGRVVMRSGITGGRASNFEIVIGGPTYEDLAVWRDTLLQRARESGLFLNPDSDYEETRPEMRVEINKDRAADLGVSIVDIGNTLQTMFGSKAVTTFLFRGDERDVIVQAADEDRKSETDIENIYVRSSETGQLIPLANLVHIKHTAASDRLPRYNRLRAITISAELAEGVSLGEAVAFMEDTVRNELPPGAQIDYKGQTARLKESSSSFYGTFGLALLVVFLVLAAQFESFRHPLIIMLTVPLAVCGALFGLFMFNGSVNIFSQVGIIILVGIAAKNGILMVEFANQLRDAGANIRDAIIRAAETRFRPIVMTGISTAAGSLPLIITSGAGYETRVTIGIVIFSGVIIGTLMTLVLVPVAYDLLAKGTQSPKTIARRISEMEGSQTSPAE